MRPTSSSQRGSALILAMLVTAVVAVLATQLSESFLRQVSLTESRLLQYRFQAYLRGGEALAGQILLDDARQSDHDHTGEIWATELPPMATDDGWIELRLRDAQSLFNVNNLAPQATAHNDLSAALQHRFTPAQKHFIRMLQGLPAPWSESEAVALTETLIDWLDDDDIVSGAGGAESLYYLAEPAVWQPANQWIRDISELRLLRHVDEQRWQQLAPWLVALPDITSLNLNTMPGAVLRGVNNSEQLLPLDDHDVTSIMTQRIVTPYQRTEWHGAPSLQPVASVLDEPVAGRDTNRDGAVSIPLYDTASHYFLLDVRVTIAGQARTQRALLYRDADQVYTVSRGYVPGHSYGYAAYDQRGLQ